VPRRVPAAAGRGRGFFDSCGWGGCDFFGENSGGRAERDRGFSDADVAIPAAYTIRGKWDGRVLAITVSPAAKPMEQRIRNFLKLTLKPPLTVTEE
jgi:hypothetical protein